jgi:dienelactone hydrolase
MHGTADKVVSMDEFATLAKQLESDRVKHEMITYSGALHAFTVFGSQRCQEEADKASWKRFADFLEMQLKQ